MQLRFFFILFLGLLGEGATSPAADLVREGEAQCVIVLADQPSVAARTGARLLAGQLERVSGAKVLAVAEGALADLADLAVAEDGSVSARHRGFTPETFLLVGRSGLAERLGVTAEGLGAGGIRLKTVGNALVLLGADDETPVDAIGSRHEVVAFLEEALGMRYLWPGELGLVTPRMETVPLPQWDREYSPVIAQRKMRWSTRNDRIDAGLAYLGLEPGEHDARFAEATGQEAGLPDWMEWQRLGGSLGLSPGHAFGHVWEKYHVEHPDWFAPQPNGSRDLSDLTPQRARLCKSNPELIEALAAGKLAELERTGAHSISLSPNDGGRATFCRCESCLELDSPVGRRITLTDYTSQPPRDYETVALTGRMVWFWNRLAERICGERPDTVLAVYAFSGYKSPPVRERLHPNLAVGLVGMTYDDKRARQLALEDWAAWSRMASQLYWRPNLLLYGRREGVPSVYFTKLAADVKGFGESGLVGTDFDSITHHWATEGLNFYALARLLWDPSLSAEAILDDYCDSGFGLAAGPVKAWFQRIEAITDEVAEQAGNKLAPYTPAVCAELRVLLDEAAELAGEDETVRARVAFLRWGIDLVELQALTHGYSERHREMKGTPEEQAAFRRAMEAKFQMMRAVAREELLALNVALIAWGSEGLFRRHGWQGAKSLPADRWDADQDGRVVPPER